MDDYQIKNDKRRLMITSVVIILVLLAVGFGVLNCLPMRMNRQ